MGGGGSFKPLPVVISILCLEVALYFSAVVPHTGPMGNEARFANHSCAPNCILQKWSVMGEIRVVLVAARDVFRGEVRCFIPYVRLPV